VRLKRIATETGGEYATATTNSALSDDFRRCLGAAFAQFEMAVVLRELVRRREVAPVDPTPERVFRRAITETPRHDAEVILN